MASNDPAEAKRLADALYNAFHMKHLGELRYFLGLQVKRESDESLSLIQTEYLKRVLEKYNMMDCKPVSSPMNSDEILKKLRENESQTDAPYRPILGSIVYAMVSTRSDLCYAVCQLS